MSIEHQNIPTEEPLYSYHAFLFPFEWKSRDEVRRQDALFEDKVDLRLIEPAMATQSDRWVRRSSWNPPEAVVQYNEVAYFYDFARPVLYDTGKADSLQLFYGLNRTEAAGMEYVIKTKEQTYRLAVDDITVSYYSSGVGILGFYLLNKDQQQSAPQDILRINALGRRVYPPFLATDTDRIGTQSFFDYADWNRAMKETKDMGSELPLAIQLEVDGKPEYVENFAQWTVNQHVDQEPALVRQLLPAAVLDRFALTPVLDDRMFVVCWYGNKQLTEQIKNTAVDPEGNFPDDAEPHQRNNWWYKYAFVDNNDKTVQNDRMQTRLLEEVTNARWGGYGTLYATCRYSLVALTGEISVSPFNALLCSHVQTIYQKIALLGLVQRASLLRFSEEVTAISKLERDDKRIGRRISSLYKQYIRFINRIYFREVTAQEQGIELYDTLRHQMRLDAQVEALDKELQELHNYVMILDEEARNEKLDLLTYFAALFVVPGFIGGYFGINEFDMSEHWLPISALSLAAAGLAIGVIKSSGRWRVFWLVLTVLLVIYILFVFPQNTFNG